MNEALRAATIDAPAPAEVLARRLRDLALARRCAAGERAAQRELFQREVDRVHHVLHRILGSAPEVEDAAQEAMLAVFRSLPRFRGEATLATWVDRITVRVAIAHLQRRRTAAPLDEAAWVAAPQVPIVQQLFQHEAARRLYAALSGMEARQRVAFVLHVIEERSMDEIAAAMGATRVATKARVWRARRELARRARRDPVLAALLAEEGASP